MPSVPTGSRPRAAILRLALAMIAAAALVGAVPALAASGLTKAGNRLAGSALITRAELGGGWGASAAPKSVPPITCSAFNPSVRGAVQIGAAISARYQESSSGPFVSQTAYVYATIAEGRAVARAEMQAKLERCLAASLVAGSGGGVRFAATARAPLQLPGLGAGVTAVGYRISGTASQPYQLVDVYLDAIVLARGAEISEVSLASFLTPPERSLELRVARAIARRLRVA